VNAQDAEVGGGLRLARLLPFQALLLMAHADGLVTRAEMRQPSPRRWEILNKRADDAWLLERARRQARIEIVLVHHGGGSFRTLANLVRRAERGAPLHPLAEPEEKTLRHAAALLGFHLRAFIGRLRKAERARAATRSLARLRAHLRRVGVSGSVRDVMLLAAEASLDAREAQLALRGDAR